MLDQREAALAVALLAVFCLSGVYGLEVNVVTPTARPTGSDSIQIQAQVDGSSNVSGKFLFLLSCILVYFSFSPSPNQTVVENIFLFSLLS
jgi:hypothetical protein